jgi:hypothetical protein
MPPMAITAIAWFSLAEVKTAKSTGASVGSNQLSSHALAPYPVALPSLSQSGSDKSYQSYQ